MAAPRHPAMGEFKMGQTVEMNDGRKGVVKFIGTLHVADNEWVGVALQSPTGKNDGSVQGERYFQCPPMHGLFVRDSSIARIVSQPAPKITPKAAPRVATRPTSKPAPTARPSLPATKPRPSSIGAPKALAKVTPASKRLSVATPSTTASSKAPGRQSTIASSSSSASTTANATTRARQSTIGSSSSRPAITSLTRPSQTTTRSTTTATATAAATSSTGAKVSRDHNVEALETKIRHLEKQHADDRDQLKTLDQTKSERDRFEGIIQKLQGKCQTFHQENVDIKANLKELKFENERLLKMEQEFELRLEDVTLDREMAEERAEQAESERELLRARLEEQELELDILRSEAELLGNNMSEEDKEATNYYRLETERDRLKEALLTLKEITDEREGDLKARVKELETDQAEFDSIRESKATLEERLITSDAAIDHLRQQLDAANEWEEIVEDLSGQNQQFKDQIAEKDIIIQDLENLKDLNDELEIQHVEHANELRLELEAKDLELAEQSRKVWQQDSTINEQELLISKFRDLVLDLQSKMNEAEMSKSMTEAQANDVTGRFNEVMELNRRLRSANLGITVKTINSGLQQLEAQEAREEIEIIKYYLPDSADIHSDNSLKAYFRAKRISTMASLVASLVEALDAHHDQPTDLERVLNDLCRLDSVHQLSLIALRSDQLWVVIGSSTLEQFKTFGPAHEELGPVERTLERCLESLKRDEVNFKEMSSSLGRSTRIMHGFSFGYSDALAARVDQQIIFHVGSIKSSSALIKAVFETIKSSVQALSTTDLEWENGMQVVLERLTKPSTSCMQTISAAGKLCQTLIALQNNSLYPQFPGGIQDLIDQGKLFERKADLVLETTQDKLTILLEHDQGEGLPMHASALYSSLETSYGPEFLDTEQSFIGEVIPKLNGWNDFASILMNNIEIERGPAPWIEKAKEIERARQQSMEAEKKLQHLTVEHHTTVLQIREREEIIDTKDLEIEHLRAKHREAATKAKELDRFQSELKSVKSELDHYEKQMKSQEAEIWDLKIRIKEADLPQPPEIPSPSPSGPAKPVIEKPLPQQNTPATFVTFVQALTSENHWLRQREKSEMFSHNLRTTFDKMREYQTAQVKAGSERKQKLANEMLDLSFNIEKVIETSQRPIELDNDFESSKWTPDWESKPVLQDLTRVVPPGRRSPIMLAPLKTPLNWRPMASMPEFTYSGLEDVGFVDLSPVAEEFANDITETLEDFSEVEVPHTCA